jgi:PKD repeat protein
VTFTLTNTGSTGGNCEELDLSIASGQGIVSVELHPGAGMTPINIPQVNGVYPFPPSSMPSGNVAYNTVGVYSPKLRINYQSGPYTEVDVLMSNPNAPPNYIPAEIQVLGPGVINIIDFNLEECFQGQSEVSFRLQLPTVVSGSPNHLNIDWGDGNSYSGPPLGSSLFYIHYYTAPGNYVITISYENCGIATTAILASVKELDAEFTYFSTCDQDAVQFAYDNPCLDGVQYSLNWYFGDGTSLLSTTNTNPSHTYPAPGNYTVELVVTALGQTVSSTQIITVVGTSPPQIVLPIQNLCSGNDLVVIWSNLGAYPFFSELYVDDINNIVSSFTFGGSASVIQMSGPGIVRFVAVTPDSCTAYIDVEVFDCCAKEYDPEFPNPIGFDTIWIGNGPADYTFNNTDIGVEIGLSNAPSGGISQAFIEINGMLVISENYTFEFCQIFMGPEAQIVVKKDVELEFKYCTVRACSDVIWNRVHAFEPTSKISAIGSDFYNARQAISVTKGAELLVDYCTFNENHTAIYLYDFEGHLTSPTPYPAIISSSRFNNEHPGPGNFVPLLYPLQNIQAQIGVHLWRVGFMKLDGGLLQNPIIYNEFYQSQNGVFAHSSSLQVFNCSFTDHVSPGPVLPKPPKVGIRSIHASGMKPLPFLEVVAPYANFPVNFTNNDYGIEADNVEVRIANNVFNDNYIGVKLIAPESSSFVKECNFTNGQTGILAQSVFEKFTDLLLEDNEIVDYQHGIRTTNLWTGFGKKLWIINNQVVYSQTNGSALRTGIRIEACVNATVENNQVNKTSAVTSAEYNLLKGIYLSESEGTQVFSNQISNMGQGIFCIGYLANAELYCNTIDACNYGVYLQPATPTMGTVMTHQRLANVAQDNFISNGIETFQVAGGNGFGGQYWRFRPSASGGYAYNVHPLCFDLGSGIISCTEIREFSELEYPELVAQDSVEFTDLEDEMRYKAMSHIYRDLEMGYYDSLMTTADSLVFYNFSQQMAATDFEMWQQYLEMLGNAEIDSAQYYLGLMEATNNLDQNNVTTAEAFLESFAWYNPFVSSTEQALEYLAYQTPYIAGRAVYSARVMLNIDNLDYGIMYKQDAIDDMLENSFEFWPNPADNFVQLVFGNELNGQLGLRFKWSHDIISQYDNKV